MLILLHQETSPCISANGFLSSSWWELDQPHHSPTLPLTQFTLLRVEKHNGNRGSDGGSDCLENFFLAVDPHLAECPFTRERAALHGP